MTKDKVREGHRFRVRAGGSGVITESWGLDALGVPASCSVFWLLASMGLPRAFLTGARRGAGPRAPVCWRGRAAVSGRRVVREGLPVGRVLETAKSRARIQKKRRL